ncbi:acyl-CoA N-acyltransferase [Trametes polyzona]|nr:acyl-CoA N-acyltransferase [Trametes polyzona]
MVNIRVARVQDVQGMQACNLQNLPENYMLQYYLYVVASYPQLSYVAEDEGKIVGYLMARMEDELSEGEEPYGHVVSISVLRTYRRLGIAKKMMLQSQEAMARLYSGSFMSLHVRKSNRAAITLYKDTLNFGVFKIEKAYYGDGEDAYVMRLPLKELAR